MEKEKKPLIINKVKNRILMFSPTVKEGLERECTKDDFFSEGDKPIGKGGFGQVWKVRHKATDKIFVIKVMSKQNIIEQKMVEQINREVEIMYKLNHSHIVKLYNHFEDEDNLYLVMHYASKGQLYSLLKKQNRFDQRTTAQYMRELISAIAYLHSFNPPIIHRDIKPENILLDENGRLKLADFGWSNYENKKRTTYCGTPEYLAPEMIKKEGHDNTVDIWDLGVLMFELLTGHPPFSGSNQSELFLNIKKHKIQWPDDFPPLAKNLISKILKQNPKERVTLDEILSHAWFEKNPPIKPVLQETYMDSKSQLESLLINVKPEAIRDEINNLLNISSSTSHSQNTSQNLYEKNYSPTPVININQAQSQSQEIMKKRQSIIELAKKSQNPNAQNQSSNFTGQETILPTNSSEYNLHSKEDAQVIEKLKKENYDYKLRSDKLESEIKTLKNEIIKLKETINSTKPQNEVELQKLKDELDKYKIMNKDRLDLLAEIEEKNNEIMEIRNKLISHENELETCKRNLKQTQGKYQEAINSNETYEIKINDLRYQIENLIKEKDEMSMSYQKKFEILQTKFLDSDKESEENQLSNTNRLLEMINESLKEIEIFFKNKTDYFNKTLTETKEDFERCEKKLIDIIQEKHGVIIDVFSRVKSSLEDDFLKIKLKMEKENSSKVNERLEWLKKQISELMPYKIKFTNLESQISKFETNIKKSDEIIELHKTNISALEKLNEEKDYKLAKKEKYIVNLEARLSDVKDYVFRNHQDKLDDFKKWYKF